MLTLMVLQLAGWNIQWTKTVVLPVQSLYHLGFVTNTISMQYSTPPEKLKVLRDFLLNLIHQGCVTSHIAAKYFVAARGNFCLYLACCCCVVACRIVKKCR